MRRFYSSLVPRALSARSGASSCCSGGDSLQICRETEDTWIRSRGLSTSVAVQLGYRARGKIQLTVKTYDLTKCAKEPFFGQVLWNESNLHVSENRVTKLRPARRKLLQPSPLNVSNPFLKTICSEQKTHRKSTSHYFKWWKLYLVKTSTQMLQPFS